MSLRGKGVLRAAGGAARDAAVGDALSGAIDIARTAARDGDQSTGTPVLYASCLCDPAKSSSPYTVVRPTRPAPAFQGAAATASPFSLTVRG